MLAKYHFFTDIPQSCVVVFVVWNIVKQESNTKKIFWYIQSTLTPFCLFLCIKWNLSNSKFLHFMQILWCTLSNSLDTYYILISKLSCVNNNLGTLCFFAPHQISLITIPCYALCVHSALLTHPLTHSSPHTPQNRIYINLMKTHLLMLIWWVLGTDTHIHIQPTEVIVLLKVAFITFILLLVNISSETKQERVNLYPHLYMCVCVYCDWGYMVWPRGEKPNKHKQHITKTTQIKGKISIKISTICQKWY